MRRVGKNTPDAQVSTPCEHCRGWTALRTFRERGIEAEVVLGAEVLALHAPHVSAIVLQQLRDEVEGECLDAVRHSLEQNDADPLDLLTGDVLVRCPRCGAECRVRMASLEEAARAQITRLRAVRWGRVNLSAGTAHAIAAVLEALLQRSEMRSVAA